MRRTSTGSWAYNTGPYAQRPIPFETVLGTLAELKFAGLELGGFGTYPGSAGYPSRDDRDRLAALLVQHGLALSAFVPDLGGAHLLDTRDTAPYVASFAAACDFAADLGVTLVRVDTVQPPTVHRQADYADLLQRLVATWERCLGYAGDRGLEVAWEFEPGYAFNKPGDVQRVLDRLQQDHFGVVYDTAHAELTAVVGARQEGRPETLRGGQLELIARLSGRIAHVHVADSDGTCSQAEDGGDSNSAHLPLGTGRLDFAQLLPALRREPAADDWWTLDLAACPHAWEVTPECKAVLDELNRNHG